jgi:hypothetical protein
VQSREGKRERWREGRVSERELKRRVKGRERTGQRGVQRHVRPPALSGRSYVVQGREYKRERETEMDCESGFREAEKGREV